MYIKAVLGGWDDWKMECKFSPNRLTFQKCNNEVGSIYGDDEMNEFGVSLDFGIYPMSLLARVGTKQADLSRRISLVDVYIDFCTLYFALVGRDGL